MTLPTNPTVVDRAGLPSSSIFSALGDIAFARRDGANWQLPGDEICATRRATRLGIIVGEQHAFLGDLVEVGRPPGHHAAMVRADVPHADIVADDDEDVWFLRLLRRRRRAERCSGQKRCAKCERQIPGVPHDQLHFLGN